jgi:capsid portal protein
MNDDAPESEKDRAQAFIDQVNQDMTFQDLLHQAAWEFCAIGWGAWEVVRVEPFNESALYPIPAHTLRATNDPRIFVQVRAGRFAYFKRFGLQVFVDARDGRVYDTKPDDKDYVEATEIIAFSRYSPRSSFYGIPSFVSSAPAMAEYAAIREFNTSFFETSGVMSRMIFLKSNTDVTEVLNEINDTLVDAAGRNHSTLVSDLPADADIKEIDLAPDVREGHFGKRREDLVKSILIAHNVPPYRVGWAQIGQMGGAPARDMLIAYRHGEVEPIQTMFERKLAVTLFGPKGLNLQGWELIFSDLDWNETELNLNIAVRGVQAGIFSPNDGAEILGRKRNPDPALDKHYYRGALLGDTGTAKSAMDVVEDMRRAIMDSLGVSERPRRRSRTDWVPGKQQPPKRVPASTGGNRNGSSQETAPNGGQPTVLTDDDLPW